MPRSDDLGKFILRIALGLLILLHGVSKLKTGVGFISGMLASHGAPGALAYLVFVGELVAPVLLIVGLYTRVAGAIVAINMLVALWLAHMHSLLELGKQGGAALELQYMYLAAAVTVALLGAGRFSLGGSGKLN